MDEATYSGEVWTDAHGFATVVLPSDPAGDLQVEVDALAEGVSAVLTAEPRRGRFTIATSEPHVKVAWRASGRGSVAAARHQRFAPTKEES
jgi:hypothetical protein